MNKLLSISLALVVMQFNIFAELKDPFCVCEEAFVAGDYDKTTYCYERMFPAAPAKAEQFFNRARLNYAEALLGSGDYYKGFINLDHRLVHRDPLQKPWDGSNPAGKTILVICEQGFGDTFFFIRFVQELKQQGATVIVKVQNILKNVISGTPYIDQVVNSKDPMPEFDYDVYVMSLPRYLSSQGLKPCTLHTIPNSGPYLFAKQERAEYWHKALSHDKNFKIGICWRAGALPGGQVRKYQRDFPLGTLIQKLSRLRNVSFYSLQDSFSGHYPVRRSDFERRRANNDLGKLDEKDIIENGAPKVIGFDAKTFDRTHGSFTDTFGVIVNVDLVISCDTAVANGAGALGAQTWTLLPHECDWRWMNERTDTPWFPHNMRLFRQANEGDWEKPLEEVYQTLKRALNQ